MARYELTIWLADGGVRKARYVFAGAARLAGRHVRSAVAWRVRAK